MIGYLPHMGPESEKKQTYDKKFGTASPELISTFCTAQLSISWYTPAPEQNYLKTFVENVSKSWDHLFGA